MEELAEIQSKDISISVRKVFLETKTVPKANFARRQSKRVHILIRQLKNSTVKNGVLYREVKDPKLGELTQILLPECLKELVLQSLHDELLHQGIERTLNFVRMRCYWPKTFSEIKKLL